MRQFLLGLLLAVVPYASTQAQESEITTAQAKSYYKNVTKRRVSVHDPSVVYEPSTKRYYIFGSHRGMAYTTDMRNWSNASFNWRTSTSSNATNQQAFTTPAVKTVKKGGADVAFPAFNAMEWSARTDANYNVNGNMWAPDVIWNEKMGKWCMYLSINGDAWHSSIILLTADKITGPYQYQGPVVICGFYDAQHTFKDTDLELALGQTLSSLPTRYNVGKGWGNRWPHTIDPAAFFDEDGKLWLVYGSWSGGIWMLELDEETGLRDYDVTYPSTNGNSNGVTSDPYFGTKIGGGYYVSGEGPYIEHIGNYYYLFVSYGFYSPDGGYEMRVFRSAKPNGPYRDAGNRSAIFDGGVKNYGAGNDNRGEKLMGAYNGWGFQTLGETAQGHNSIIAADDGRTYLVYHTKFNDGRPDAGAHQVRVHQVFQNKSGWLVAAPFEYNGDATTDADIASKQLIANDDVPGTYQLLVHKYKMDYANMEEVKPVEITLTADGKVTGAYTGTWSITENTSYLALRLGSIVYNGVLTEQTMDEKNLKAVTFTAMATNGVNVWGFKYRDDYSLAWQLNNQTMPVSNNKSVLKNLDLYGVNVIDNVGLQWTTDRPDVISDCGKYYPLGLADDTDVTLTARLTCGRYFWQQPYTVKAWSEEKAQSSVATWSDGMLAHYTFDDASSLVNSLDISQTAQLLRKSTTALPTVEDTELLRNGSVVHLNFGASGKESYVAIPNPLKGKALEDGATVSFFVKRTDDNQWDALFGCIDGTARLFMTGNLYLGFNDGKTESATVNHNWIDINNPNTVANTKLGTGQWHHVVVTFQRKVGASTGGVIIYVDGNRQTDKYEGKLNGTEFTARTGFDYGLIVDQLAACDALYLGYGSYWGSPDARFDDFIVYDRPLSAAEVMAFNQMIDRSDKAAGTSGISEVAVQSSSLQDGPVYDLSGRRVETPHHGLYIRNGKKILVK
jgi:arabinan endo-1,5-alpha-L-arabinosidase